MELPKSVRDQLVFGQDVFSRALKPEGYKYHVLELDCALLPAPRYLAEKKVLPVELREAGFEASFFDRVPANEKPCLYRFEIAKGQNTKEVFAAYEQYKGNSGGRATSAIKKKNYINFNTETLYVGKVKEEVGGRLVVHAGYYHVKTTGGLQLVHWAKAIGLRLYVHVVEFEVEMAPFVSSFELDFSRQYQPLIGKQ
jgi:hypothetical protein